MLVQEFLTGDEYVVDTVTLNGKTVTCNVFSYEKERANGADFVYRAIRAIDLSSPISQKLIAYNNEVIKAVGIFQGAGHREIMLTDNEPCLVEIGARLHGGNIPSIVQKCAPWSQIELLIDACIDQRLFEQKSKQQLHLDKKFLIHFYISSKEGMIEIIKNNHLITSLDSYFDSIWYRGTGDYLDKTIDLYTCPLKIILANRNKELLLRERNSLIDIEKKSLLFRLR
ncbi:MAG: Dapdiamide A synthase [Candidatus Celerinatantimonas neptuna]|nr:MAG: Dapdiamide A synthase [Candidatus Celerinatantimonas neptuna]